MYSRSSTLGRDPRSKLLQAIAQVDHLRAAYLAVSVMAVLTWSCGRGKKDAVREGGAFLHESGHKNCILVEGNYLFHCGFVS